MTAVPVPLNVWEVFLRLLCAMVIGTIIGTEREYSNRPAGMRTHILVALGACTVMLTGQMIFTQYYSYGATPDPARLAAQVITGVGFLGAGTIMKEGPTVHGLTTAASLWAVACLGVAAGGGYYSVALIGVVFIFITLTFFELLQRRLISNDGSDDYYCLNTPDIGTALDLLNFCARKFDAGICDMKTSRLADGTYQLLFRADIGGFHSRKRRQEFLKSLTSGEAVTVLQILRPEDLRTPQA